MTETNEGASERVYKVYWQDGSVDLFVGASLVAVGVGWIIDQVTLAAVAPAISVPIWSAFRTKFIEPRIGYVKFDEPRRRQIKRGHIMLILLGWVTLLAGVAMYFLSTGSAVAPRESLKKFIPALPAMLIGTGMVLAAVMFSLYRFAIYGGAFVCAGVVVALLRWNPGWSLLAGGIVAAASGAIMLSQFFRQFPKLQDTMDQNRASN